MINYIKTKRAIKRAAGLAAVASRPFARRPQNAQACVLMYHRVADIDFIDPELDDWNVHPAVFERQIAAVSEYSEVVPLADLLDRLNQSARPTKPLVAITFDDGYANFHTHALPVLQRYQTPATVFLVTSRIGSDDPPPFDAWSQKNSSRVAPDAYRSLSWQEVEDCLDGGVVSVGSHSHRHLKGTELTDSELCEEACKSREVLAARLGADNVAMFAYPYGSTRLGFVTPGYVEAVQTAGYRVAVCSDVGMATAASDRYLVPRVEVHALDSPRVLRAKMLGAIGPYRLIERLRKSRRAV